MAGTGIVVRFADGRGDWGAGEGGCEGGGLEAGVRAERGWGPEVDVRLFLDGHELAVGAAVVPPAVVLCLAVPRAAREFGERGAGGDGGGEEMYVEPGDVWEHLGDDVRWLRALAGRLVGVVGVAVLAVCAKCPGAMDREIVLLLWGGAGGIVFLLTAMLLFNKDRARDPQPEAGRVTAIPQ